MEFQHWVQQGNKWEWERGDFPTSDKSSFVHTEEVQITFSRVIFWEYDCNLSPREQLFRISEHQVQCTSGRLWANTGNMKLRLEIPPRTDVAGT